MRHGRERGWLEQGTDEVRSWFGDDEAEHRRMIDNRAERLRSNTNMYNEFERGADDFTYGRDQFNRDRMPGVNYDRMHGGQVNRSFGRTGVDSKFGRGPKDYKRSDERICEEIHECFSRHHELDATDIQIEVKNGEVTLRGTRRSAF